MVTKKFRHRPAPRVDLEFLVDVADMRVHRRIGDFHPFRDFPVVAAACQQFQHLRFPRRQAPLAAFAAFNRRKDAFGLAASRGKMGAFS